MMDRTRLTEAESVWLIAWNIAAGGWDRIGLAEADAKGFLLDLIGRLGGDPLQAAKQSRTRLQQCLMAMRRSSFAEIQRSAPFSRHATRNMETLLRGWLEEPETGFARMWEQIFAPGWEAMRERQNPIEIKGRRGDSEEVALEVKRAADRETTSAAEWWYLYYTFGG